jgi:excisionase family DNA binding protein
MNQAAFIRKLAEIKKLAEPEVPSWCTIEQAARILNMSEQTVRRRITDGTLTAHRVGPRLIRIDKASLVNLGGVV